MLAVGVLLHLLGGVAGERRNSAIVEGYQQDFAFVARFGYAATSTLAAFKTFGHTRSSALLKMQAWTFLEEQRLLIYTDNRWFDAYMKPGLTCGERARLSTFNFTVPARGYYGTATTIIDMEPQLAAPEVWHLALARCREWGREGHFNIPVSREPNGIFMYYTSHMLNEGLDEFSTDEVGLWSVHLIFVGWYGLLSLHFAFVIAWRAEAAKWYFVLSFIPGVGFLCASAAGRLSHSHAPANSRRQRRAVVPVTSMDTKAAREFGYYAKVELFFFLLLLHSAHHALALAHYERYRRYGLRHEWLATAAEVVGHAASVLLTVALLWISKGYTVTVTQLRLRTRIKQGVVSVLLVTLYTSMLLADIVQRDVAAAWAAHESMPARLLVAVRLLLALWFTRNVRRIMRVEATARSSMSGGRETRGERTSLPAQCERPVGMLDNVGAIRSRLHSASGGALGFYRVFLVAGAMWLVSLPLWHAVAAAAPAYMRHQLLTCASASSNALLVALLVICGMGSATSVTRGSSSEDVASWIASYTMLPQMHVAPSSSELYAPTTIYPLSQACSQALESATAAVALATCATPSAATYASAAVTAAATPTRPAAAAAVDDKDSGANDG